MNSSINWFVATSMWLNWNGLGLGRKISVALRLFQAGTSMLKDEVLGKLFMTHAPNMTRSFFRCRLFGGRPRLMMCAGSHAAVHVSSCLRFSQQCRASFINQDSGKLKWVSTRSIHLILSRYDDNFASMSRSHPHVRLMESPVAAHVGWLDGAFPLTDGPRREGPARYEMTGTETSMQANVAASMLSLPL